LEGVEQRRHLRSRCLCFPFLNLELWESLNIRGERKGYGSCCVGHIYIYIYVYIYVYYLYIYIHIIQIRISFHPSTNPQILQTYTVSASSFGYGSQICTQK
jgi:hypothetical protein